MTSTNDFAAFLRLHADVSASTALMPEEKTAAVHQAQVDFAQRVHHPVYEAIVSRLARTFDAPPAPADRPVEPARAETHGPTKVKSRR